MAIENSQVVSGIRVGDYRIIYNIEDKVLTVFVIDIAHRKDIYD